MLSLCCGERPAGLRRSVVLGWSWAATQRHCAPGQERAKRGWSELPHVSSPVRRVAAVQEDKAVSDPVSPGNKIVFQLHI